MESPQDIYNRRRYRKRVLGLCRDCKNKTVNGSTYCPECQVVRAKKLREERVNLKKENKCIRCRTKLTEWDVSLITNRKLSECNSCMERKSINRRNKI